MGQQPCIKSTEYSIRSRRCFMTGEYCSQQTNIHKERHRLHQKGEINAFVIMNFSDMSDVVYEWRLKDFIRSLKKYLLINEKQHKIACVTDKTQKDDLLTEKNSKPSCDAKTNSVESNHPEQEKKTQDWKEVKKINVIRADSNPVSNFVICNRVCQQMQMADLVIVDVSVENANVFYELGLAVSLRKFILPICYSDSYFYMQVPDDAAEIMKKQHHEINKKKRAAFDWMEKHIDCYPWQRKLFEYYGIRYQEKNSKIEYKALELVSKDIYGFSDMQYSRFPYDARIQDQKTARSTFIGSLLYDRLKNSYNDSIPENDTYNVHYNTLVVYTMDRFLNEAQAGQCIVNFYNNITRQMEKEHCFCGDRVAILGQANSIPDDPKDSKTGQLPIYGVKDILLIGMNQATFTAQQKRIKPGDYMRVGEKSDSDGDQDIRRIKEYARNRCIPVSPDNPIYVTMLQKGLQKGILDTAVLKKKNRDNCFDYKHFFCLFHVMLYTLRYTNEIVVDISQNSPQALFWLGAAHGSNVYAVIVRHSLTEKEQARVPEVPKQNERHIFDVSGLWTAKFQSNDTAGFYQQLALTQIGIEQHSKITLSNTETREAEILDQLYGVSPYLKHGNAKVKEDIEKILSKGNKDEALKANDHVVRILKDIQSNDRVEYVRGILVQKNYEESEALESLYRDRFWQQMLRYNKLNIYLPKRNDKTEDGEPQVQIVKWDVDAMADLSRYLSKRKVIGEYYLKTLADNELIPEANSQSDSSDKKQEEGKPGTENFIRIGSYTVPESRLDGIGVDDRCRAVSLADYISTKIGTSEPEKRVNVIHRMWKRKKGGPCQEYRGFYSLKKDLEAPGVHSQFLHSSCIKCEHSTDEGSCLAASSEIVKMTEEWPKKKDERKWSEAAAHDITYVQPAQLILWREINAKNRDDIKFMVSLVGVSGPSTYALTSLLVDSEQKVQILNISGEDLERTKHYLPLNTLQTKIREIFFERYFEKLGEKESGLDAEALDKIKYMTGNYLSTFLYQYFLPFLSHADEVRICNSMEAFVRALSNSQGYKGIFNQKSSEIIVKALRSVLESFCGVEALYQVEVQTSAPDTDTRIVKGIHAMDVKGVPSVSCLFAKTE